VSEIKNYKIDFVERTREVFLNDFDYFKSKGREVTFLLNFLLGLIVTVNEVKGKNKAKKGKIEDLSEYIPDKIGFLKKGFEKNHLKDSLINSIEIQIGHKDDISLQFDKQDFLLKIRNGIAHQHIEGISRDGIWEKIRLWNVKDSKIIDFEIIFTIEELKNLAIKIADDYLGGFEKPKEKRE
jgi:hypothetical protein